MCEFVCCCFVCVCTCMYSVPLASRNRLLKNKKKKKKKKKRFNILPVQFFKIYMYTVRHLLHMLLCMQVLCTYYMNVWFAGFAVIQCSLAELNVSSVGLHVVIQKLPLPKNMEQMHSKENTIAKRTAPAPQKTPLHPHAHVPKNCTLTH